ncbi:SusD/RagB family nutrient-binding outer membrane lipoprotein [Leeuwenhoekiella sp. NPDC079379]|uniref:SusD/RagB family nutrient-binding outer membrane lipoprotein n=1 Tax=Leeuwenhoekiella sp. NPDC079379 TaxID=3364122 RepID=UPI0037CAACCE
MKKYIKIAAAALVLGLGSCDSDFTDVNTDPDKASEEIFDPNLILPDAIYKYANSTVGYRGPVLFQSMWVQLMASTSTVANYYSNADKYVPTGSTNDYAGRIWEDNYRVASEVAEMSRLSDLKGFENLSKIGVIVKVMSFAYMSDIYGDIPFSEALQLQSGISRPIYDKQEDVYPQLLIDLDTAISGLDDSGDKPTSDIIYEGDIAKWKKFGYSLMLKMAMRLVEVDETLAQTYIEKAAAGGVFASADDEAVIATDNSTGFNNGNAAALGTAADLYEVRWSDVMIDFLKSTDDPRLSIIAEVPQAGLAANQTFGLAGNSAPANQLGLPNGFDINGGATDISTTTNYPGPTGTGDDTAVIGAYSRPTGMYRNLNAPIFILTYAETQLLLAEAAVRGYNVSGTASSYYANALTGALTTIGKFGGGTIAPGVITTYATDNPLDLSSEEASLEMINTQYWATTGLLGNFVESWSNWRRSNYPVLQPVNYVGNFSQGMIPVRQIYPSSESTNNPENYNTAASGMGGDTWTVKVWWDVN